MDKKYRKQVVEMARKRFAEEGKECSKEVVKEALECLEVGEDLTGDLEEDVAVLMDAVEFVA